MFSNSTFLITGIADKHSLAMSVAKEIIRQGGKVICTGLGVSPYHLNLSDIDIRTTFGIAPRTTT